MIRFNNDYNRGAHPRIMEALAETNGESYGGYGLDFWCEKAQQEIMKYLDCPEAKIHFLVGGTQTNVTVIASALKSFQGVICPESGHIHVHETGAVEHAGHKVLALPQKEGKIRAEQIEELAREFQTSDIREHVVQPKMVYLSFPTEYGTIYSRKELEEIRRVCLEYGLYLFVDGARLGYGLGSEQADVTMKDLARLTDVFYIGGTKCGALFGEAVVITNPALQEDFRSYIKQNGAMLAKGWLLGLQFYTLFQEGLYFDITRQADRYAMKIKEAFAKKQIPAYVESFTNQQFVVVENTAAEQLAKKYVFEFDRKMDEQHCCIRFCTSWSTTEEEVDALTADILAL